MCQSKTKSAFLFLSCLIKMSSPSGIVIGDKESKLGLLSYRKMNWNLGIFFSYLTVFSSGNNFQTLILSSVPDQFPSPLCLYLISRTVWWSVYGGFLVIVYGCSMLRQGSNGGRKKNRECIFRDLDQISQLICYVHTTRNLIITSQLSFQPEQEFLLTKTLACPDPGSKEIIWM